MRQVVCFCSVFLLLTHCGCDPKPTTPVSPGPPPVVVAPSAAPEPVVDPSRYYQTSEIPPGEIVKETSVEQSSTFLLYYGIHIRPPYRLIRTNYKLVLEGSNARVIMTEFPQKWDVCPERLPVIPSDITEQTTFTELDQRKVFGREQLEIARLYFACQHRTAEAAKLTAEYVRSLPFVASAEWAGGEETPTHEKQYLRILSKAGEERRLFYGLWDPSAKTNDPFPPGIGFPVTEHLIPESPEALDWIQKQFKNAEGAILPLLSGDHLYLLHDKSSKSIRFRNPEAQLAQLGQILASGGSVEGRTQEVAGLLEIRQGDRKSWSPLLMSLITAYDASPDIREYFSQLKTPATP